ncbi:IS110 family transposase [Nitrospira sp.]|nr:IS110 family transposase [Nitrospira sp.]
MRKVSHERFCGIDLHQTVAQVCVCDSDGEIELERRFPLRSAASRSTLVEWVAGLVAARVAVEALGLNRWLVNALMSRGLRLRKELVVVHAPALKLKESGRKTDRRDAREIARRLWLGDLDRVGRTAYPSDASYDSRQLTRTHHDLVRQRQSLANRIRSFFRAYAIELPRGTLHGGKQLEWLRANATDLPAGGCAAAACVELLASVQEQIKALASEIARRAECSLATQALTALPQLAHQSALTIVHELGDVGRFDGTRAVASYAGLVPRVTNSGETKQRHGPLDKRGNRELRWILGQWAVRLLTRDTEVRRWAAQRLHRISKNRLRTALARRLLIGVYISQRDGVSFCLTRCLGH